MITQDGKWVRSLRAGESIECPTETPAGLFFSQTGSKVRVGSSPAAVMSATECQWILDPAWPADWLLRSASPARTPFPGLRRLLPGQRLTIDPGGQAVVTNMVGPDVWGRPDLAAEQAPEAYRSAFAAALRRLVPAGDVASELSGGLDSTFMVGCLAQRGDVAVQGYSWTPDSRAHVQRESAGDLELARRLQRHYPDRIDIEAVTTTDSPLRVARLLSRAALWPAFGPSSLPWTLEIRRRATASGAAFVLSGVHGNAAFSTNHRRPSVRSRWRRPSAVTSEFLRVARNPPKARTRANWLTWLAGQDDLFAAIDTPGVFGIPRRDPYRAPEVLEVAARIRPEAWLHPGLNRGFARTLAAGVVPDEIRLNPVRFVQSSDSWYAMFSDRDLYERYLEVLFETPELTEVVDRERVAVVVRSWPWGQPFPAPPLAQTAGINRILALAQFTHDAREVLAAFRTG